METLKIGELLLAAINLKALFQAINPQQNLILLDRDHQDVMRFVDLIQSEADRFDLISTRASVRRLKELLEQCAIKDQPRPSMTTYTMIDAERIRGHGADMTGRLADDIGARMAMMLPPSKAAYFNPTIPIFGKDVADKFPNNVADIVEAGNCFALGRNTACVFHLMRVTEAAVQEFGRKLGVSLAGELMWQNILDRLNPIIKNMDHRAPHTVQCAAIQSHLYNVKVAWRNAVMHPKATYDEGEARAILNHVNSFLIELVKIL